MDDGPLDDDELVLRALGGDREAFGALVRRHQGAVLLTARYFLRDGEEARDAGQEAFLKAWAGLAGYRWRGFRPWILTIVRRNCLDVRRASRTRISIAEAAPASAENAEERVRRSERRDVLVAALAGLSERQRTALLLAGGEGCTAAEVAAALGCSRSTARVTLLQARRKALRALERHMETRGIGKDGVRNALLEP